MVKTLKWKMQGSLERNKVLLLNDTAKYPRGHDYELAVANLIEIWKVYNRKVGKENCIENLNVLNVGRDK